MAIQFGAALGLAVVTAVYLAVRGADGERQALLDAYRSALVFPVARAVLGVAVTAAGLRRRAGSAVTTLPDCAPA